MQTIQTKYLGPTNTRGSRVKAWCSGGSLTISWNYALGSSENHAYAIAKLKDQLGWSGEMVMGNTENGFVAVFKDDISI